MTGMQNQFIVLHDLSETLTHSGGTACEGGATNLAQAMLKANASIYRAYVCHVATDLQLHRIGTRFVWLDGYGREQPAPKMVGFLD